MWAHSGGHPFFFKYDVAEIVADIRADISAGMCADICAGMCADICTGMCAETLPRLFTRNDCRVHCRASNPQPRFFFACFFAGIPAAIEVSYYSVGGGISSDSLGSSLIVSMNHFSFWIISYVNNISYSHMFLSSQMTK